VTVFALLIMTVQVLAVPVQAPDQPLKTESVVASAVKVTLLFWLKLVAQVAPQLMPVGELVTVPSPVPALVTVNGTRTAVKLAVTVFAAPILTVQVLAVPVQAPDQPLKVDPVVVAAVKVTLLFLLKLAAQVLPQLIPEGELVTVPLPVPDFVMVSVTLAAWAKAGASKRARSENMSKKLTFVVDFMLTVPYCGKTRFCKRDSASYTRLWLRANWPLGSNTSSLVRLPLLSKV
jgi:hypothetical protein